MGPPAQPAVWNPPPPPVPQRGTTIPDWSRPEKHVLDPSASEGLSTHAIPAAEHQPQPPPKPPSKPRKRARVSASGSSLVPQPFESVGSPTTGAATAATAALTLNTNSPQPGFIHPNTYAPSPSHPSRPPTSFTFPPQPQAISTSTQAAPHHQPQQAHHQTHQQQQYAQQQSHHPMQTNSVDLSSQPQQYPVTSQAGAMYSYRNTR